MSKPSTYVPIVNALARPVDLFAGMNGTEKEFALILEARRRNEEIRSWRFEAITLTLGVDCRYTPDFYIIGWDGDIWFAETKGFWRDDAKVKIRVAARLFPEFTFTAHRKLPKKKGGGWIEESFTP